MDWEPDWNLRARMGLAVVLIALLPFAFAYSLVWLLNHVVVPLSEALLGAEFGGEITISVQALVVLTSVGLAAQYFFGDRLVLRSTGARRVGPGEYPAVHGTLGRLARQVDLPMPSLAVVETEVPNAFAMGRSPDHSTVVVTSGLLDTLDETELEAVLAHELAHVKNRDVAIMSVAYLLPTLTYVVAVTAYTLLGGIWNVVGHLRHTDSDDARPLVAVIVIFVVTSLLTLAVSTFFWAGSFLLFRLLSRYREFAADRGSARITGNPTALATALEEIDTSMERIPDRDLREHDGGIEALYVSPLDTPMFTDDENALISRDIFPETHPPTRERVDHLKGLAAALER